MENKIIIHYYYKNERVFVQKIIPKLYVKGNYYLINWGGPMFVEDEDLEIIFYTVKQAS